jgi:branched-subunit amino acid aminotransferase/4-amino-4-deoxychorismate lyase
LDGAILAGDAARVPADDSAIVSGLACYTTARWDGERIRFAPRHGARLAADALQLGLGRLAPERVATALALAARAAFGGRAGIVRLQASRGADGALRLLGLPRELGPEPAEWSAQTAAIVHEGPGPFGGAKLAAHPRAEAARGAARAAGCDEALLYDAAGRLVEGARTALVVVRDDGAAVAPPAERGGVASLALALVRDAGCAIAPADLARSEVVRAREVVALNAVRGAVPIVRLDGAPVGTGTPGPVAARLRAVLTAATE